MPFIPRKKLEINLQNFICWMLVFVVTFTQVVPLHVAYAVSFFSQTAYADQVEPAEPANEYETVYDLVAIIIDKELAADGSYYEGLLDEYGNQLNEPNLDVTDLEGRVLRYANDIRDNNEYTDVRIIIFDKEQETVYDLVNALENLYINGDDQHKNRLSGVVLVGDVPLPVVNKSGNKFISMFPYTDFENKSYIYNDGSQTFELNETVEFPKADIWHGVIRAPENGIDGRMRLAEFFDKNHLYHEGVPEFANFDRKMFFADFIHEEEAINSDVYKYYLKYLEKWEDLAYMRYNKFWAQELLQSIVEETSVDAANPGLPVNENHPGSAGFLAAIEGDDPLATVPDIYTKNIIDTYLIPYYKLLTKQISQINNFAENTHRFAPHAEDPLPIDSVPSLITVKDEYTKAYLKNVNDALEKAVNEIAYEIEEPLPLLQKTTLSGGFLNEDGEIEDDFKVQLTGGPFPVDYYPVPELDIALGNTNDKTEPKESLFRFHYFNEELDEFFVNGIEAKFFDKATNKGSAKMCAPFLGSTKSDYFDQDLNFNPLAVDGDYSILTRALRSDNVATAIPLNTVGVNTRLLSPEEASTLTSNKVSYGAVIEDNLNFGVPAFIKNPDGDKGDDYKNLLDGPLKAGDVIFKVNGKEIGPLNTFDQAIKGSYDAVNSVITKVNNDNAEALEDFEYPLILEGADSLSSGKISRASGNIGIEVYRNGTYVPLNFTFTVDDKGRVGHGDPAGKNGGPEVFVLLSNIGFPADYDFQEDFSWDGDTDGVMFTLYDTMNGGFGDQGYDISAGCNANSASKNSDRCFYMLATLPVFDPAGSLALVKQFVPGVGDQLMFPEDVNKNDQNQNSADAADYENHNNIFQIPDSYEYEDIDEVYYDSCFAGLPSFEELNNNSNQYAFPLDPNTKRDPDFGAFADIVLGLFGGGGYYNIEQDIYGQLLKRMGDYVKNIHHPDNNDDEGSDPADAPGNEVWLDIDDLTAADIVLNNVDGDAVTLKDFTDRYGLFDGQDNDGDNIRDYQWRDLKLQNGNPGQDGIYDTKWYDYDAQGSEASISYALPSGNLAEIARKMLSNNSTYILPAAVTQFDRDILLKVEVENYNNQKISTVILHNEPTVETISEQVKSMGAFSMPIDNPRYVAFQTKPNPLTTPANIDPNVPNPQPHYFPGKTQKIVYPNLFEVNNYEQLVADLTALADQIALMPGAYKVFGANANPANYSLSQIKDKVKSDLLAVVTNALDNPTSGFDLTAASTEKIRDALTWRDMNIDEKHAYILKQYLNSQENAFVNDATLFPQQNGYELAAGYEAAYLVVEGEKDYFNITFNKDIPEETDPLFNPLSQYIGVGADGGQGGNGGGQGDQGGGEEEQGGGGGEEDGLVFVDLDQFLKETQEFIEFFTTEPNFKEACSYAQEAKEELAAEKAGAEGNGGLANNQQLPLNSLAIKTNKGTFKSNGVDKLVIDVTGFDAESQTVGSVSNGELITLNIIQSENAPVFEITESKVKNLGYGKVSFNLRSTENSGTATFYVSNGSGITSNSIQVESAGTSVELITYVNFVPEGMDELQALIKSQELLGIGDDDLDEGEGSVDEGDDGVGDESGTGEDAAGDGEETDGDTAGSTVGDNEGSSISRDDEGAGEGGGSETDGSGDSSEDGDEGEAVDGDSESTEGENSLDEQVEEDLLSALNDAESDGLSSGISGDESASGSGVNGTSGATGVDENGNIVILESEEVKEIKLYSTLIEGEEEEEEEFVKSWEEYYLFKDYYLNFIGEEVEASNILESRLIASIYSDQLLAFKPGTTNPFIDFEENENSKYHVIDGDSMVADNDSVMKVQAHLFKNDGLPDLDKNYPITFSIQNVQFDDANTNAQNIVTFVDEEGYVINGADGKPVTSYAAEAENGVATVYVKAGKKAGNFQMAAKVEEGVYPEQTKQITLLAGEPTAIFIEPDSHVLVANNESKTKLKIIAKDKFGNVANNTFAKFSVFVLGDEAYFDASADTNSGLVGTQLDTLDGSAEVDLFSLDQTGKFKVIALILDNELEDKFLEAADNGTSLDFQELGAIANSEEFEVLDKVDLNLQLDKTSITADGSSVAKLRVEVMHDGKVLDRYYGPVDISLVSESFGSFIAPPPKKFLTPDETTANLGIIESGNIRFKSSKLAGVAEVLVNIPGFVADGIKLNVVAGEPSQIELKVKDGSDEELFTGGDNQVTFEALVLDQNGNLTTNNSETVVNFRATGSTKDLISFSSGNTQLAPVLADNGVASLMVTAEDISGQLNLVAEANGLVPGTLSIPIVKKIDSAEANKFAPRALYTTLLGGAFGNVRDENNLASSFLYSSYLDDNDNRIVSQVQSLATTTATSTDKKRLLGVDAYGKIDLMSENMSSEVILATDSFPYQRVILKDELEGVALAEFFLVPQNDPELILMGADEETGEAEGIYVQRISETDQTIEFNEKEDGIYIERGGNVLIKVDEFGRISLNDESLELRLPEKDDGIATKELAFVIIDRGEVLAQISFKQNFTDINGDHKDVTGLSFDSNPPGYTPGVYLKLNSADKKYAFAEALTRASSEEALGLYLVDVENEIDSKHAVGSSYNSLENIEGQFGLGFEGKNKHMLLFAAGNSVGESHLPYSSEAGIIFGDPTIRLEVGGIVGLVSNLSHFTKDLGKPIFFGDKDIVEILDFDFNGDGMDDILLIYEDGLVRLLENEKSRKRFRDKGYILSIYGGAISATKIDLNNDGYDDLVVGTEESCRIDEEIYSVAFINEGGQLTRSELDLAIDGKPYEMKADDLNQDGCEDLVVSDSSANVRVFYNDSSGGKCNGVKTNYGNGNSWNFGFEIDPNVNMSHNLFMHYPGVQQPLSAFDANGELIVDADTDLTAYIEFVLPSSEQPAEAENPFADDAVALQASLEANKPPFGEDLPEQTFPKEYLFLNLIEDNRLGVETAKFAKDVNGGAVASGDEIEYTIYLKNSSAQNINNLLLSDLTPGTMNLNTDSLECLDNNCPDDPEWVETKMSLRSHVIEGLSVPANGVRTIKYSMTVNFVPKVNFDLGNDFKKPDGQNVDQNDDITDILVRPSVNPDGVLRYLVSKPELNNMGEVQYELVVLPKGDNNLAEEYAKMYEDNNIPDPTSMPSPDLLQGLFGGGDTPPLPASVQDSMDGINKLASTQNQDSDFNGCVDSWGGAVNAYEDFAAGVAGEVENLMSLLRCSGGGCLPIPYNYVFLAPDGAIPGISVVAFGVPNPIGMAPMWPSMAPSSTRIYINPTLTMGLGTSVCVGAPHSGACYAFAVPLSAMGVCPDFLGPINDAVAAAKEATLGGDAGMSTIVSDGEASTGSEAVSTGGNYSDPDSPISAAADVNIRVPGFPSVITNWIDKQTDEIYAKLLDLPDFYFIYPDAKTLISETAIAGANFSKISSLNDFLSVVNSLPLIQIEGKEAVVHIPAISQAEIEKYKRQAYFWIQYHEQQIENIKKYWSCDTSDERKTVCDSVTLDLTELISSVRKLLNALDQIAKLPQQILQWRHLEAKYATQIICYLDAVMMFTGGYIRKQQKTVEAWMQAIEDVIRTFKDWKLILDLMVEYQTSCDECKNDRFSKLGFLLQLFVAIPEPPIIPLPKWPNIVFDVSQIKTGIKIQWPDLTFVPEPIVLPDLPTVTIPEIAPELKIKVPGFDVPPWLDFPEFVLPDLPDLPPLPLPELPDLPRPPKIPKLPNIVAKLIASLKPIIKILCLLKKGLVPVLESSLATEIETLTQPSIDIVLPIVKQLSVQFPAIQYDYVKEIRINAKLNMGIDTSFIYQAVKYGVDKVNDGVKDVVSGINEYTTFPLQTLIDGAVELAEQEAKKAILDAAGIEEDKLNDPEAFDNSLNQFDEKQLAQLTEDFAADPYVSQIQANFEDINTELNSYIAELEKEYEAYPDTYYLTASQSFMEEDHPLLNRSLAEVEAGITNQNLPTTPEMQKLANLRDSLIAYTKDLNSTNDVLQNIDDFNEFNKILVDNDKSVTKIASIFNPAELDTQSAEESEFSFLGEEVEEMLYAEAQKNTHGLIAANFEFDPNNALGSGTDPVAAPKGFYVVVENQNENILNYTDELGGTVHTLFSDVDNDNDHDIIYTLGGDVYLKENYENYDSTVDNSEKGDVEFDPFNATVKDFVNLGGDSVDGVNSPFESHEKVDISWLPKDKKTVAYEVVIKNSLYDTYQSAVYKFIALVNPLEDQQSIDILNTLGVVAPTEEEPNEFVFVLDNKDKPRLELQIENGNYYANVFALDAAGNRSLASVEAILAPQICADKDAPFPAVSKNSFDLPIFKTLEIDAGNSFDPTGEVTSYFVDVLPYEAEDPDKPITNLPALLWSDLSIAIDDESDEDNIVWNDRNNPLFKIGGFTQAGDIGVHRIILNVLDQSRNSSEQNIDINVFVPEITLDQTFATKTVAVGETIPAVAEMPFALMRNRFIYRVVDGELKLVPRIDKVVTDSTRANGKYYTDQKGEYQISDFDLEDMILVEDIEQDIVAEIHPETGNIGALASKHKTKVNSAVAPVEPTSVDILDDQNQVLGTVYLVADPNSDVKIHENVEFDATNYKKMSGVNVSDVNLEDELVFVRIPADDLYHPGGALLINKADSKHLFVIDTAGNTYILDEEVSLKQKANDHAKDPLVFEIWLKNVKVAEIYIEANGNFNIVGPNDVPFVTPRAPGASSLYGDLNSLSGAPFSDFEKLEDELKDAAVELYGKDIIDGTEGENKSTLAATDLVNRAQFVKIVLKMLCIIPRDPEAYQPYDADQAGGGFADIAFSDPLEWFYPYIKEAALLGLVDGYKGELESASGLYPFKPENSITRAEAVKIILEALDLKGIIDIGSVEIGTPWYEPFMEIGQDLTPYLTAGNFQKSNFIITEEEAANPNQEMTLGDLMLMATRVLDIYNCFEIDSNQNGLSDFCEAKYNISDPYEDLDNDGLENVDECYYGLDPRDEDTDKGGALDGIEIDMGSNPKNGNDDPDDSDGDGLSDQAELLLHGTDPFNPDTDSCGLNDGQEVKNLTNPLSSEGQCDDGTEIDYNDGEEGIYIVPAECNSCPCQSTFLHKADVIPGDIFFSTISTFAEDYIFTKSEDVIIQSVTK